MPKDKKQKKDKKPGKNASATKAGNTLTALAQNPLIADVVAAALVATASALKDPQRARALASEGADELAKLSKDGAERGSALWEMALQIGKRSLEAFAGETKAPSASSSPKTRKKDATGSLKKPAGAKRTVKPTKR